MISRRRDPRFFGRLLLGVALAFVAVAAERTSAGPFDALFGGSHGSTEFALPPGADDSHLPAFMRSSRPFPAVARIIAPEEGATAYGSGTLIDVRDQYGLVITNWHVVRDATGEVEVVFPGGFRSKARPLKVDEDWDLAALVVWRPPAAPVKLADRAPQSGDILTICGYGQGEYRAATGRCTKYYAPKANFPEHMVELDVEARQGDSGGPIFNDRGELAGVLFGAGEGTTLGSFGGRVQSFLATLAPDIGRSGDAALVDATRSGDATGALATLGPPREFRTASQEVLAPSATPTPLTLADSARPVAAGAAPTEVLASSWTAVEPPTASGGAGAIVFAQGRNVLAVVGALAIVLQVLRLVK